MRVDISPRRLDVVPGQPQLLTVTVSNTSTLIGGYSIRVLGADPSWVHLPDPEFPLFPDETRVLEARITVPPGIAAGERRIAIQVRELTPPETSSVEDVVLAVPEAQSVMLRVDPMAVTSGRVARFSVLVDNTGNTTVSGPLQGLDPEGKVRFRFEPPTVALGPGEHAVVDLKASARPPFAGSPLVRLLDLRLGETPAPAPAPVPAPALVPAASPVPAAAPVPAPVSAPADDDDEDLEEPASAKPGRRRRQRAAADLRLGRARKKAARGPATSDDDPRPMVNATFVQRPLLSRGPLALLGLLVAVTVFAIVITLALSRIVGQSAADRNLALEIASAQDSSAGTGGTAGVSGVVRLLTSGTPVPGVAVNVFDASDTDVPLATTATDDTGAWSVVDLPAGSYKVTFRGAGFVQLWYPQAVSPDDAETLDLEAGNLKTGLDVALGGVPASLSGTVVGDDVSAATLTLKTPLGTTAAAGASGAAAPDATTAEQGATVRSIPIGADGTFELPDVPSPSVYDLVVTKQGYATSTQRIDVAAGEERKNIEITLRQGDGLISGTVNTASGPLGGASITATSGQTTVTTMSLTDGDTGSFTLRGLPTPASFTVVASLPGYASQTLTLTLADGQRLTGVSLTLGKSSGSLNGTVSLLPDATPAPGVLVTVTDGKQTVQTATQSTGDIGSWKAGGLSVPGTYTVTFARSDLASQTVSVDLDSSGNLTPGSQGATITADGIDVSMQPSTAVVEGVVTQQVPAGTSGGPRAVGEVTVQLSSGSSTYTVTTASVPGTAVGRYRLEGVPAGTYTVSVNRSGVRPTSEIVQLEAGQTLQYSPVLAGAASISGTVVTANGTSVGAGYTVELYRSSDYPGVVYRVTTTGADGGFSFEDVDAPEAYIVQVRRTPASPPLGSSTVQLEASEHPTVKVRIFGDE